MQRANESFDQLKRYASKVSSGTRKVLLEHALSTNSDRKGLPSSSGSPILEFGPDPSNPEFTVGEPGIYRPTLNAIPPPRVYVSGGTLPPGMTLDSTTGEIYGVPQVASTYGIGLLAQNGECPQVSLTVYLKVSKAEDGLISEKPNR